MNEMSNLSEMQLDLIIASLAFANMNKNDFQQYLKNQGHFETLDRATNDSLDKLRQYLTLFHHQTIDGKLVKICISDSKLRQ